MKLIEAVKTFEFLEDVETNELLVYNDTNELVGRLTDAESILKGIRNIFGLSKYARYNVKEIQETCDSVHVMRIYLGDPEFVFMP
jgi:hypothetical protein